MSGYALLIVFRFIKLILVISNHLNFVYKEFSSFFFVEGSMDYCCTDNGDQWVSIVRFLPFGSERCDIWFCSLLLHSCLCGIHCIFDFPKWCSSFFLG